MVEALVKTMYKPISESSGAVELVAISRILLDVIPPDKRHQNAWKVMSYLAEKTIADVSETHAIRKMSTKEIHMDLGGNKNREPSGWLSPLWKDIDEQWYPAIKETVIAECKAAGYDVYPVMVKSDGSPSYYWIEAQKISTECVETDSVESKVSQPKLEVVYRKDLTLKLSLAGRLVFGNGMKWTAAKRYSFISSQLLYLAVVLIYIMTIMLVLWAKKGPLGGQELVMLIFGAVVTYVAYSHGSAVWRLFDDRIIIAPDWTLAWKEYGAAIEINRSNTPNGASTIQVNRYSATCPICGWMVKLDKGEPDFPRRIIGRCEENPREHVFSFDRSTKSGSPLIRISALPFRISTKD